MQDSEKTPTSAYLSLVSCAVSTCLMFAVDSFPAHQTVLLVTGVCLAILSVGMFMKAITEQAP